MKRRELLAAGAAALAACAPQRLDLTETSLDELIAGLHSGRWSSHDLTQWYLRRIDSLDRRGPALHSVLALHPKAHQQAEALDRELKAKGPRSPLHGIPILIKDNIDTFDMPTTAGSLALEHWTPPEDAPVTARLRAAGAVILGKTNLSEWANFRSTRSSSGWSALGGQTLNPHATDRSPSGSSSGSGSAAAASLSAAAIGTETDGSIVSPSSSCGIAGLKPTVGAVPATGIVPIAHSQDTAGPMARSVRDAALLFQVLADTTVTLDPRALRGARLGVARNFFSRNQPMNRFLDAQIDVLKKCGAEVIDETNLPAYSSYADAAFTVLLYEFRHNLNLYLSRLPAAAPARNLDQLIAFNDKNSAREMPVFGQEIFLRAQPLGPLTDKAYLDARALCLRFTRTEGIDALLSKHRLDALVAPTGGPAWLIDHANGDYDTGGCSSPAAIAGYPHVTVPAGFLRGLPIGLSFFGAANTDARLLSLAYSFEQATHARRRPALKPGGPAPAL